MTESIVCPICKELLNTLSYSDAKCKVYFCRMRKENIPGTDIILNNSHYSVHIDEEHPDYIHKEIKFLPYTIEVHKFKDLEYTRFTYLKTKPPAKKLRSSNPGKPAKIVTESIILKINKAVTWDFSNRDSVIEKIKIYVVFS